MSLIYLDNASTTWPKPPAVIAAMSQFMIGTAANPGRGGHSMSLMAGRAVFNCRAKLAN
ncbi:MAG: aminotransferase class V-fold PLP-dependent enzyme, partial [bacterium]|nr:aminotransferase class V-fold PLP-dependent enzyme [bacterium]